MKHNKTLAEGLITSVASAAVACQKWVGKQNANAADQAAVEAMSAALNKINATIVVAIGEGERDEAPMLHSGQVLGNTNKATANQGGGQQDGKETGSQNNNQGLQISIAVDPLEGTNACKENKEGSLSVMCAAQKGEIITAPDVYMNKLATAIQVPKGMLSINESISSNIANLSKFIGKPVSQMRVCALNRERNRPIINEVKQSGAQLTLIEDGDVMAILKTHDCFGKTLDLYVGTGGAPEGVLASAFIQNAGGFFEGKFCAYTEKQRASMEKAKISPQTVYTPSELVGKSPSFFMSFVTKGFRPAPTKINIEEEKWLVHVFASHQQGTTKEGAEIKDFWSFQEITL